jgi:Contractile injection system tube protein
MLTKLKIEAYSDENFGSKIDSWEAQINPELYRREFRTLLDSDRGIDTAGSVARYRSIDPEVLVLDIVLDATGVVEGVDNVTDHIDRLKTVAYDYNGDIHSPNYLRLLWGELVFNCVLERLSVAYVLFSPAGEPLRARLSMTLLQHRTPEELAKAAHKSSPDLAHTRRIRDRVGLPILCAEIYGDPRYNVAVARTNGLTSLRRLPVGQEIGFPPLGAGP